MDIEKLMQTFANNLDLSKFKGDIVAVKHVENEINNVEAGGIGIQIVNEKDEKKQVHKKETAKNNVLSTPEAETLWAKAIKRGWVDENKQPLISNQKAAILASVMADELKLSPRWEAFEKLWNIKNMPNCLCKAQDCSYYAPFMKSVEAALL